MSSPSRLLPHLEGSPFALPAALDRCSERWWRLPPRVRAVAVLLALALVAVAATWRVEAARRPWGGPARRALIAVEDSHVGDHPSVRPALLPPALVPPDAPQTVTGDATLTLALPEGAVLTRSHLSSRGPAVGLDPDLRVVPLPVQAGLGVAPGGRVDVWVLAPPPEGSRRIAEHRPVIGVSHDDDDPVALIGLGTDEVGAAVRGMADGQVLLTHAPP